jgi:hypothetical protein
VPDGYEPHQQLARIWTLRDLMQECRVGADEIINMARDIYRDPEMAPETRLRAGEMILSRGFGKPRQHHVVSDNSAGAQSRVVILPDNGRSVNTGKIIDSDE